MSLSVACTPDQETAGAYIYQLYLKTNMRRKKKRKNAGEARRDLFQFTNWAPHL